MMSLDPSLVRYSEDDTRRFFLQLADARASLPGVKSVTLASSVPMATDGIGTANVVPEGFQLPAGQGEPVALLGARRRALLRDDGDSDRPRPRLSRSRIRPTRRASRSSTKQYARQLLAGPGSDRQALRVA